MTETTQNNKATLAAPLHRRLWSLGSDAPVTVDDAGRVARDPADTRLTALVLGGLILHIVAWTIYASIAHGQAAIHDDMSEAWAWGREFQLGYYKHPPLYSWIVGVWFKFFPRENWSYYLLSSVNATLGLAGAWAVAGRFVHGRTRAATVLFLTLTPFYNFLAINFNANSILLSLWPWTTYFFIRSLETRRASSGLWFGLFAACAMLSKYYSALLLICCLSAALAHPGRKLYFRSAAPYVAVIVCALACSPHAWWVMNAGAQPLQYALEKAKFPTRVIVGKAAESMVSSILYQAAAVGIFALILGAQFKPLMRSSLRTLKQGEHLWIVILALGPFVLTLLAGFLGHLKISSNFTIPIFYMVPVLLLMGASVEVTQARLKRIAWASALVIALPLLASPVIAYAAFVTGRDIFAQPRKELARAATDAWQTEIGKPLLLVTGTPTYSLATAFYTSQSPSEFIQFRMDWSPWVTQARIDREGLLIICTTDDPNCPKTAAWYATPDTKRVRLSVSKTVWGRTSPPIEFQLFLVPPLAPAAGKS